jgi:hypothetical protein
MSGIALIGSYRVAHFPGTYEYVLVWFDPDLYAPSDSQPTFYNTPVPENGLPPQLPIMSAADRTRSYKRHDSAENTIRFIMLTQFIQDFCEKSYARKINESDIMFFRELNAPKEH